MKKVIQFIILPLFCLILGAGLALTNAVTKPKIAELEIQMATEARQEVLPMGVGFTEMEEDFSSIEGINSVYKSNNAEGIAVDVTVKGYGGDLNVMIGVDRLGNIANVKVVSGSETAGVGAKTYERDFLDQYEGKSGILEAVKNSEGQGQEVAAISGATVSSKAVTGAVNKALDAYEMVKEEIQ